MTNSALAEAPAAPAQRWPDGYFTVQDGTRLHYVEAGEGYPVILIHGARGSVAAEPRQERGEDERREQGQMHRGFDVARVAVAEQVDHLTRMVLAGDDEHQSARGRLAHRDLQGEDAHPELSR